MKINVVLKNSIYLSVSRIINMGFGAIFWFIAQYVLPIDEVGKLSAMIASTFLITNISLLGIDITTLHYFPELSQRKQKNKYLKQTTILNISATLLIYLVYGIVLNVFEVYGIKILFILISISLTNGSLVLLDSINIAENNANMVLFRNIFISGLKLILLIIATKFVVLSQYTFLSIWFYPQLINLIILLLILNIRWKKDVDKKEDKNNISIYSYLKFSRSAYLVSVFINIPIFFAPIFVDRMGQSEQAAILNFSWMAGGLFWVFVVNYTAIILANKKSIISNGRNLFNKNNLTIFLILIIGLIIYGFILDDVIFFVLDPQYIDVYQVSILYAISSFPALISFYYITLMRIEGNHEKTVFPMFILMIVSFLGSILLYSIFEVVIIFPIMWTIGHVIIIPILKIKYDKL